MDDNQKNAAVMGAAVCVMVVGRLILDDIRRKLNQLLRQPHINRACERDIYINSIVYGADYHCVDQIRMKPTVFFKLCKTLAENRLLHETIHMSIKEQLFMFLHIIGHNVRLRVVGGRLFRSIETVHRYFGIVLKAILRLYTFVIKQPHGSTPPEIRTSKRFYPFFKDCVGAIDGTHIRASAPIEIKGRFRNRKGDITQNVLAAITFDLKFTYVLAGWEGSAHDSRVLKDALSRPGGFTIPEGKYYLGDAGYGNRNGVLSPYRATRYHLKEFSSRPPENKKELYNLRHSSLRTTIERGFGVLKKRFRMLDSNPYWSFPTQVEIVLACVVIHNFIMGVDPRDSIMEDVNREATSWTESQRIQQTRKEEREESREWNMKRDAIAQAMWEDYISSENV